MDTSESGHGTLLQLSNLSISISDYAEEDWRKSRKTLKEKLAYVLNSNQFSYDTFFVVRAEDEDNSVESVPAHSFMIKIASAALESLFTDSFCGHFVIHIKNVEPATFRIFLKFIYTEELDIPKVYSIRRTGEILFGLIKLGVKYGIPHFTDQCCQLAKHYLPTSGCKQVFEIFELAVSCRNQNLYEASLAFIVMNGQEMLDSQFFLDLSYHAVTSILLQDELAVDEVTIFNSVYQWAEIRCPIERRSLLPKETNLKVRNVLGDILFLIRFPLMSPNEFCSQVIPKNILTAEEKSDILQYISVSRDLKWECLPKGFCYRPRLPTRAEDNGSYNNELGQANFRFQENNPSTNDLIQESISNNPKYIILTDHTLNFNDLLESLSRLKLKARSGLRSISLQDVYLVNYNNYSGTFKRYPTLQNINFDLSTPKEDMKKKERLIHFCQNNPRPLFFFAKKSLVSCWSKIFVYLCSNKINTKLAINSEVLFNIDFQRGNLVLNKLNGTQAILELVGDWEEEVSKLSVSFEPCEGLTSPAINLVINPLLYIHSLVIHHGNCIDNLGSFIGNFLNLKNLVLTMCGYKEIQLGLAIALPRKVIRLALAQAMVRNGRIPCEIAFNELRQLFLWNCLWDTDFEESFLETFPRLKEIQIYNSFVDKSLWKLIEDVLKIESLEKILISGFIWGIRQQQLVDGAASSNSRTTHNNIIKDNSCKVRLKNFLKERGLSEGGKLSFCIYRNMNNTFGMGEWLVREVDDEEIWMSIYQHFQYEQFYSGYEAFKVNFQKGNF